MGDLLNYLLLEFIKGTVNKISSKPFVFLFLKFSYFQFGVF